MNLKKSAPQESVKYFCNHCHTQAKGVIAFESLINTEMSLVKIEFSKCKHSRTIIMKNIELKSIKKGFKKNICGRRFITPHTTKQIQEIFFSRGKKI